MRIAFFDLDKTIIKKDSIIPFMIFYLKKNPKSIIYYIRLIPYLILFFLKIIDNNKIKYEIASIFRNITIEFGEKIGKENFTTKGKNRGHGLLLVNEIVKNNTIFETKRNIKNDIYSQTIIVKKP